MIKIYKLTPDPVLYGIFDGTILKIGNKEIEVTREKILDRFNRGYYRCGEE